MHTHHERRSCRLQDVLVIPDITIFLGVDVDEERRLVGRTWNPEKENSVMIIGLPVAR
jgi:hypothetical protein